MVTTLLAAALVGGALALTGAALQSVLRNPLAEPYLLGTVGGAAFFAALATVTGLTAIGAWVMPAASLLGSCTSLALVCIVAAAVEHYRKRECACPILRSSSSTLVLAGFVIGGFMGSMDMLVLSFASADDFTRLSKWLYGSLSAVTPAALALGTLAFALVLILFLTLARQLDVLELGRSEAECLGINARALIFLVLVASSLMTAVSVALAGAVGFVGLVVPHIARRLFGPRLKHVFPASAILGAVYLVLAELLRRKIPADVPVGVIAAIFGAPLIFALLLSRGTGEARSV